MIQPNAGRVFLLLLGCAGLVLEAAGPDHRTEELLVKQALMRPVVADDSPLLLEQVEQALRVELPRRPARPEDAQVLFPADRPLVSEHRMAVAVSGRALGDEPFNVQVQVIASGNRPAVAAWRRAQLLPGQTSTIFLPFVVPADFPSTNAAVAILLRSGTGAVLMEDLALIDYGPDASLADIEWVYQPVDIDRIEPKPELLAFMQAHAETGVAALIDETFNRPELFRLLAELYDPETGGFHAMRSALEDPQRFPPDLESTGQAIRILHQAGALDGLPESLRRGFIRFYQERQDPRTGFFHERREGYIASERMLGRAFSYSMDLLELLGAQPLHPLPAAGGDDEGGPPDSAALAAMSTVQSWRDWLDRRPWRRSWTACGALSDQKSLLMAQPEPLRTQLIEATCDYVARIQDPATGDVGFDDGINPYIIVSGAMKMLRAHEWYQRPIPRADRIHQRTLKTVAEERTLRDLCWTRNPVTVMHVLQKMNQLPPMDQEQVRTFVLATLYNMNLFRRDDGGWSRTPDRALAAPNGLPLGQGAVESCMNGTSQALVIREELYQTFVGHPPPPLAGAAAFVDELKRLGKLPAQ